MLDPFGLAESRWRAAVAAAPHPMHPGWPEVTPMVRLARGPQLRLRPLLRKDGREWRQMRLLDEAHLRPVEPTAHRGWDAAHTQPAWHANFMALRDLATQGTVIPLVIELDGAFAGQLTLGNIQHGGVSSCWIGYWVFSGYQGLGAATAACALGTDHAFRRVGLHRVTATYLPSNPASGRVLANNGYREEGLLRRNLHIDGQWRDHVFVAQTRDEKPGSCVERLRREGKLLPLRH
ncbi:Putative ribosomal N-acetyltransferase YdaF [Corynebacterium occultum]|uniref:Ribosomal N-acetyltransferase YdaF n=1 Tax=Corynebacterium occultum TaxID=2675219 RepID=A0A6B8VMP4_9CORY|nr:GNAT family protein [Corynebacterium occultum]QGU06772.1 Putative ribosomal N-acetyltransferase YdaF [Corynebacterium occultum]